MKSLLKERFARLGPIQVIAPGSFGSPAAFVLRLPRDRKLPATVDGALSLVRCGLTLLRAKRVMEELVATRRAFVKLPKVADRMALTGELAASGIAAAAIETGSINVRRLRERLGLTREQFAAHYGLEIETVRNWEIGKRAPDTTATSYLQAISNDPETVERAYAPTPSV
jgi:putative transcriptional regulator